VIDDVAPGLRSFWRFGSQRDNENQLQRRLRITETKV